MENTLTTITTTARCLAAAYVVAYHIDAIHLATICPVSLTARAQGRLRLFAVDNLDNPADGGSPVLLMRPTNDLISAAACFTRRTAVDSRHTVARNSYSVPTRGRLKPAPGSNDAPLRCADITLD